MDKGTEYIFEDKTFSIIGAALEVHKILGPGFLEAVYHEAMEIELNLRKIPYESHKKLKIPYKSHILNNPMKLIFLCIMRLL